MWGEGHAEVEDKSRKFVLLSSGDIDATYKEQLYDDIFQREIK